MTLAQLRLVLGDRLRTLRVRLSLIGVLALAVGIGTSTALLVQRAEHDTLQAAKVRELETAVHNARLLGARLREAQRILTDAATQLPLGAIDDAGAMRRFLQGSPVLRGAFDAVFVVGPDGRMRVLADVKGLREPGTDVSDRSYFRLAVAEQRPTVSELIVGRVNQEPMVALGKPLQRDGRTAAVLVGTLMLKRRDIASVFTEGNRDPAEHQLLVVSDAGGRILSHAQGSMVGAPLSAEPRLLAALARWQQAGRPLEADGFKYELPDAMVGVAAVPGADWLVWSWHDKAAVLAPLIAGRTQALRAATVLLLIMGAGLLALLAWSLRPLAQLQARAHRLFDGTASAQDAWPRAWGEIGDLAHVLQHVASEHARLATFNAQIIQRLQSVMAAAPVGITFTRNGCFELVSAEFCRLLGRDEASLLGQPAHTIHANPDDHLALVPLMMAAFAAGRPFDGELVLQRGDGSRFPGRLRGQPVDPAQLDAGTIWSLSDVTDDKAAREALEWAASHDPLTGLANRTAFDRRLAQLFAAMPRALPSALLLFDLDRFKPINDVHGHAAGDAMLRAVATAVLGCVRGSDLAVRLGGDEFAFVLERCPVDGALRVAEDIRSAIAAVRLPWHGQVLSVGASVGMATLSEEITSPAAWIAAADAACYAAKAGGRDQVQAASAAAAASHLRLVSTVNGGL